MCLFFGGGKNVLNGSNTQACSSYSCRVTANTRLCQIKHLIFDLREADWSSESNGAIGINNIFFFVRNRLQQELHNSLQLEF